MFKAIQPLVFAFMLAGLPVLAASAGDQNKTVAVKFAKGTSSSTVSGAIHGYDTVSYTLGARAGQTMTVHLGGSKNCSFNIIAPGEEYAMDDARDASDYSGQLPASGTYRIEVFQPRAQARRGETSKFTLRIAIK